MPQSTIEAKDILLVRAQNLPQVIVGISEQVATLYAKEMYENPEFTDGVIKPTQKMTLVDPHRFVEFLRYKDANRFK